MNTKSKIEPYWLPVDGGKLLPRIGLLKASSLQTNGAFEFIEYTGPAAPPPHVHELRDEAFFVLNGLFTFTLGTEVIEATSGAFVFVPRGPVTDSASMERGAHFSWSLPDLKAFSRSWAEVLRREGPAMRFAPPSQGSMTLDPPRPSDGGIKG
jgi:Cupin domain